MLAILEHLNAVDEDLIHPYRSGAASEGRAVRNLRRIEDDDVGEYAGAKETAIGQAEVRGWEARKAMHGLLERNDLLRRERSVPASARRCRKRAGGPTTS